MLCVFLLACLIDAYIFAAFRYPLDVEKLPEEAVEILETAAAGMEAQLTTSGQQATHTALEALALAVLDMSIVDATIASIAEQVHRPSPSEMFYHTESIWLFTTYATVGADCL